MIMKILSVVILLCMLFNAPMNAQEVYIVESEMNTSIDCISVYGDKVDVIDTQLMTVYGIHGDTL